MHQASPQRPNSASGWRQAPPSPCHLDKARTGPTAPARASGSAPNAVPAQPLPTNRTDLAYSFAPLVKRVSPAVVNIYTTTTARVRRLPFPIPGMPQEGQRVQNSLGSGVLVKADGLIVTNAHVVKGA